MPTNDTLELHARKGSTNLYSISPDTGSIESFIATSPGTRAICNDPGIYGLAYTNRLRATCAEALAAFKGIMSERETVVVNILRGGLNFGLREAIGEAYGWNAHTTCFLSAQRARDNDDSDKWHITENSYRKIYYPDVVSFVVGDVVATGTSLRYGLHELIDTALRQRVCLRNILFFTYGGPKAGEILAEVDARCRKLFPNFGRTILIYIEGRFTCPDASTPLTIKLTGTDLVKFGALMAPELVESQYENPLYPLERCIIYDAGSRAFWTGEYLEDVLGYWRANLELAKNGMTYERLVGERMPNLDPTRFGQVDLAKIAASQVARLERLLG